MLGRAAVSRAVTGALKNRRTFTSKRNPSEMTTAERQEAIREANKTMKGYVETRILAKQGKLRKRKASEETQSASKIQLSMLISLAAAFIASPILGKKIATDQEFRDKYIPDWYDFRIRAPSSAWTRQELHEQLVEVERDMRERAIRGEFTPEKLQDMKRQMHPRSDLTEEDLYYAKKYGWGKVHPGVDDDDEDDEDD
ncbi:unnamed protein product [Cylindrotheca closterium]|uniref:Uncharacterized protein n=1 Tax=Cylindrotheca closterium TaxID=2856 RepID=A0AAD2GBF3_9STRA|nr:unnamed protein product [Cylindrotheca closterium]